jgi:cephalosporin-C deacetylase
MFDMPLDQLQVYRPARSEPPDFDAFWRETLEETERHALTPVFVPVDTGLRLVDTWDVTFQGFAGHPIKAWLLAPRNRESRLPCVVEVAGYGGGRGLPLESLTWSSLGYAHLVMDLRGQGSSWRRGDTPDLGVEGDSPHFPGFMTRGVLDPRSYYYRRLFVDGVRAVAAAAMHPVVDSGRIAVMGGSQGGGIALAVAGLSPRVACLCADVPFLCHFREAVRMTESDPYCEITRYCRVHQDQVEQVFTTLSYFDGVNFGARGTAPALFSVGLMDEVCPPRTVFAAFNHYGGEKRMAVYPYNHHEGGGIDQTLEKARFLRTCFESTEQDVADPAYWQARVEQPPAQEA